MTRQLTIILVVLASLLGVVQAGDVRQHNDIHHQWSRLSTDSLYTLGKQFYKENVFDSALICFSICEEKSDKVQTLKEKSACVKSLTLSARLYFINYEYDKACEQLLKAQELCNEEAMSENLTGIYMEQGALMMTYAQQRPKEENFTQAEEAYRKAFWHAVKHRQYTSAMTAFFNLGNRLYGTMRLDEMKDELEAFGELDIPSTEESYDYLMNFYYALHHIHNNDMEGARRYFHRQLLYTTNNQRGNIFRFQVYANLTKSFVMENNIDSAIYYEEKMFELATTHNMKDAKTLAASVLSNLYAQKGDSVKSAEYSIICLQQKDSLLSVNNLDEVKLLNYICQQEEVEPQVNNHRNTTLWVIVIIVASVILLIVVGTLVWYRKREGRHDTAMTETKPTIKYENCTLKESTKQEIANKVAQILKESDIIYNQEFCLAQLAEMCESNSKYVSQVINEYYGQNFASLINSARVEEACRRIKDKENYGTWTLEGISQSVGFKSRVTFYNAFKKHLGIPPSEYMEK